MPLIGAHSSKLLVVEWQSSYNVMEMLDLILFHIMLFKNIQNELNEQVTSSFMETQVRWKNIFALSPKDLCKE